MRVLGAEVRAGLIAVDISLLCLRGQKVWTGLQLSF